MYNYVEQYQIRGHCESQQSYACNYLAAQPTSPLLLPCTLLKRPKTVRYQFGTVGRLGTPTFLPRLKISPHLQAWFGHIRLRGDEGMPYFGKILSRLGKYAV